MGVVDIGVCALGDILRGDGEVNRPGDGKEDFNNSCCVSGLNGSSSPTY